MQDHDTIWDEWRSLVNMAPSLLEKWLATEESNAVGDTKSGAASSGKTGGGESTGHRSGRRIIEIRHIDKADLADEDWAHMAKVVGYIKRHMKQRPAGDVTETHWRYSLMNWGHDPLKD
jgi:hypothetical protein